MVPRPAPTRGLAVFTQDGQRPLEHAGVEFPGLPVHVAEDAGEGRRQQGRAEFRRGGEELVDEAVLALAQGERVEPRRGDEGRGVGPPRMRGGKDQGHGLPCRADHAVGRLTPVRLGGRDDPGIERKVHLARGYGHRRIALSSAAGMRRCRPATPCHAPGVRFRARGLRPPPGTHRRRRRCGIAGKRAARGSATPACPHRRGALNAWPLRAGA